MNPLRKILLVACFYIFQVNTVSAFTVKANAASMILTPPLEIGYTLGGYCARMSK
jgi:hypothetical protein